MKKKNKGKKTKRVVLIIVGALVALIVAFVLFMLIGLSAVSKTSDAITFTIAKGESRVTIIDNLYNSGVIKSKLAVKIYVGLKNIKLQAGEYTLDRGDSATTNLDKIANGLVSDNDTINVTFVEGKRVTDYAKVISENFGYKYDDVIAVFKDKEYAQSLISSYPFLSNAILDDEIYYPLEGYLFPNTYSFYKSATIESIIEKMLKETGNNLNELNASISDTNMSIHDIITKASIIEAEGTNASNRAMISQVIDKRIEIGMNLGMDVTAYYAVQKDLTDTLTKKDLESTSKYNTRLLTFKGLPVGPVCNPSLESVNAALNPSQTNYLYFYASNDGTIKFAENYNEFLVFKRNG